MSDATVDVFPPTVASLCEWLVDDGATVEEGEHIATVESMKTMFPVYAPASGTLRYKIDLGEIVGQEDPIAVIEVP
ncbi:MAG TPA: acetyl-CoA carboxylase biotin carboxyl carrier protein subunit [Acetobacteraceae bacterium]|jgi:acetyl-CoA/propionyl-CoA carboxylase biotin carboxyl carrier protein|nr:acetyl-CoA carboxylase biotin carboxyl carrier protein subunit [Acetobacteraceae bacterium]